MYIVPVLQVFYVDVLNFSPQIKLPVDHFKRKSMIRQFHQCKQKCMLCSYS